eukprot:316167-Amphidinium_carterae.4
MFAQVPVILWPLVRNPGELQTRTGFHEGFQYSKRLPQNAFELGGLVIHGLFQELRFCVRSAMKGICQYGETRLEHVFSGHLLSAKRFWSASGNMARYALTYDSATETQK